ncbi:hypothetical protein A2U01_0059374, partial [Trifolium medium]|nr:hypothetical protein [Trifolium medium]
PRCPGFLDSRQSLILSHNPLVLFANKISLAVYCIDQRCHDGFHRSSWLYRRDNQRVRWDVRLVYLIVVLSDNGGERSILRVWWSVFYLEVVRRHVLWDSVVVDAGYWSCFWWF